MGAVRLGPARPEVGRGADERRAGGAVVGLHAARHAVDETAGEMDRHRLLERRAVGTR